MKRLLIGIAAVTSFAADLPARVYTKAPAYVAPVYDWTGFYIGLNGGYSWGNSFTTYTTPVVALPTFATSQSMNGWVFGGQAGYNWQFNRSWVLGIEGDIDATGQDGTATLNPYTLVTTFRAPFGVNLPPTTTTTTTTTGTFENKLPWLGTLRGRVGFLADPRVLLYVTGGLAVGEVKSTSGIATTTTAVTAFPGGPPLATATAAASALAISNSTQAGWTVGAGVEGAIGGNWTAKLEYLYVDLGTVNNSFAGVGAYTPLLTSSHVTDNILRVGVNYRFGGPVVARY